MHWISAGFLMFFCSVASYLLVRRSVALKTPSEFMNLAMFALPTILFGAFVHMKQVDISVNTHQLLVIVILAIFFSYIGNKLSLTSIEYAPNPGYSLVISKSYVIFTTIATIFLFGSPLSFRAAIAILIIVFCSALIMIDTPGTVYAKHVRPTWLPLSLGAFFCWGMLTITSKYLSNIGVGTLTRLVYSMGIVTCIIAAEIMWKRSRWKRLRASQMGTLLCIGVLSAGFNWGMQEGFRTAPNIGYINAMNAASIGLVVVGAYLFFRDDLTPRKFIGVIGVIAGLILLVT